MSNPYTYPISDAIRRKHNRHCRECQRRTHRNRTLFASLVRIVVGSPHPIRGEIDARSGTVYFNHAGAPRKQSIRPSNPHRTPLSANGEDGGESERTPTGANTPEQETIMEPERIELLVEMGVEGC
jgi:hypothetical protein